MGRQRQVHFADTGPTWPAVAAVLQAAGAVATVRMIDGLPAFPDEVPAEDWRELRLGFPAGMVTLRRQGAVWSCVIWGDSDPALTAAWDLCCWAAASAGHGRVLGDQGVLPLESLRASSV